MKKYNLIAATSLLALTVSGFSYAGDMSYTYIEAAYLNSDGDDGDVDLDLDGFGIAGSVAIGDTFFVEASYADQDGDGSIAVLDFDAEGQTLSVGFGAHWAISDSTDIVGAISYVDVEVDIDSNFGSISGDDDGFGVRIGLRGKIGEAIELEGGVHYLDLDEAGDDTSISLDGRYYFTENFAAGVGAVYSDDVTAFQVGIRFEF